MELTNIRMELTNSRNYKQKVLGKIDCWGWESSKRLSEFFGYFPRFFRGNVCNLA